MSSGDLEVHQWWLPALRRKLAGHNAIGGMAAAGFLDRRIA
jgi:hypothetical protein